MTRSLFALTEDGDTVMYPDAAIAYEALLQHTITCAQCNTDQRKCEPGTALRRALRETRR
ncbi:hypothetical protein ACIQNU_02205 [Streptomyces sp. NPDC091292]|uniref:hypothetical protein n=1 Tax=Streptomyces sp. NPDC091292 TaxID=3365991 RepID=UPI0037F10BB5